ncbi:MAG: 30S ribosomal protein S12 methylthiotransferase RimO [Eggerthellaceae bacterium]
MSSLSLITLGCAKNEVDSAAMRRRLHQAGYSFVEDPAEADVIIVNTCCFIQAATEESIDAILEVADLQHVQDGDAKIVVAGCMPARYGEELNSEFPEASSFVPCSKEDDIVKVVSDLLGEEAPVAESGTYVPQIAYADDIPGEFPSCAYVKISDGCNRMCSYCTIPFIRGRYHSFPYEDIAAEVARCVEAGVKEVTLIAQDTGRWGKDFPERSSLAWLMGSLADEFPETWFRVMYIQPEGITDELLSVMASHDNICSYLDIPLQHVDPQILRNMNRKGSAEEFLQLIDHVRECVPDVTLRTTFIAGFPGETEEAFADLIDFVSEACFDYVGVFPFSPEEGTKAAELPDQLPEDVKVSRAQDVRDVADAVSSSMIAGRIGTVAPVLVLGAEEDGQLYGRTQSQAPEVDGVTFIDGGEPGEIVNATIIDTMFYEMEAERIEALGDSE